jgi:hypothetical protein
MTLYFLIPILQENLLFKNLTGLHTSEGDGNKQTTKIWEWK